MKTTGYLSFDLYIRKYPIYWKPYKMNAQL